MMAESPHAHTEDSAADTPHRKQPGSFSHPPSNPQTHKPTSPHVEDRDSAAEHQLSSAAQWGQDLQGLVRESRVCRVCLLAGEIHSGQDLITSCGCAGTTQFIHYECLARWVREKGNLECELCHQSYKEPFRTALEEDLILHGHDPLCSRIDIITSAETESRAPPAQRNPSCMERPVVIISVLAGVLVGVAVPVWIGLIIGLSSS